MKSRLLWPALLLLAGCAGSADFRPVNVPGASPGFEADHAAISDNDTMVALAFSGGGMRASAFSYGVLKSLSQTPAGGAGNKKLIDEVDFVSGVSGGSVTAAYFALKGADGFYDFRQAFLEKNAEADLGTEVSLSNILRILSFGGVNDRNGLPVWLDKNVFHGATYADVLNKRPALWITASDIFNRTPFVFSGILFQPICSDITRLPLSQAVAASAAVPGAFTPVNLESFADQCSWDEPPWSKHPNLYYGQKSVLDALHRYRDIHTVKYIKLLDGGLTDNFGVEGVALTRLSHNTPYAPMNKERAMKLKNMLFVVVNSGRGPEKGEWNMRPDNPSIIKLVSAVTDTAIDANTHVTYDFFLMVMKEWKQDLVKWRCALPKEQVLETLGEDSKNWKCDNVEFFVTQVDFNDAGADRFARLNNLPTTFVLPHDDIDFLIESADVALKNNATYSAFLRTRH